MVLSKTATGYDVVKSSSSILEAADRAEPKIRRAMLSALRELQAAVPDLEALIASGDAAAVASAVAGTALPPELFSALADATATAAIEALTPEAVKFNIAFNDPNQRAIRWAQAHAAEQVSGITTASRIVVEELVEEMILRGLSARSVARQIEQVVPLLPNHQEAVNRLFLSSIDDGVTVAHAEKIAARKAKKLLRYRAEMIARTEAITASNMGQQLLWETALDMDLMPQGTKKIWLATGDDRTCVICAVMDGQTVEVTSPFRVTRQATGFVRSGDSFKVSGTKPLKNPRSSKVPPAHPQCRCTLILETFTVPDPGTPAGLPGDDLATFDSMRKSIDSLPTSMRENVLQGVNRAEDAIDRYENSATLKRRIAAMEDHDKVRVSFQRRSPTNAGRAGEYAPRIDVGDPTTLKVYAEVSGSLESADEIASTFIHELTHAMDDQLGAGRELVNGIIVTDAVEASKEARRLADVIAYDVDHPFRNTFVYAGSDPAEALADLVAMEIYGIPERVWAGGYTVPGITPEVFRREFPEMSDLARRWINGNFDIG